jgi:hypothetical protein
MPSLATISAAAVAPGDGAAQYQDLPVAKLLEQSPARSPARRDSPRAGPSVVEDENDVLGCRNDSWIDDAISPGADRPAEREGSAATVERHASCIDGIDRLN